MQVAHVSRAGLKAMIAPPNNEETTMLKPPLEIIQAAQKVERWYADRGIQRWTLGGIQSVDTRVTIVDNTIDPQRPLALERALEYAINRGDGKCFVAEGKVILDPETEAARALLPYACWKWKEYFVRRTYEKRPASDWPEIFAADDDRLRPV